MIFDHGIRVKYVGANLISPAGLDVLAFELAPLGFSPLFVDLSQSRCQDLERGFLRLVP